MGPWSFPIVAEARMAERLLEVERARLARTGAAASRARRDELKPLASPSGGRRLLVRASAIALVACLVLGGAVMRGSETAAASVVPVHPPFPIVMSPALVSGEWLCLSGGYCEVRLDDPRVGERGPAFDPAASSLGDGPLTGTFRLAGPDGAWAGPVIATWDDRIAGSELFIGVGQVFGREGVFALQETEAYEGWAFLGAWSDPMNGEPAQVGGVIYQGLAPDLDALRSDRAAEPDAVPASVCGLPYIGWPVGPMAIPRWTSGELPVAANRASSSWTHHRPPGRSQSRRSLGCARET
jgi:hypothetical protein